jgi:hypothetical protein
MLPAGEFWYRLPALLWSLLTVALAFHVGARWRGLWFAWALTLILLGSQVFVFLAQINRFYSMPLSLLTATAIVAAASRGAAGVVATAVLATLTVLSHNITVAVFALACGAACVMWWFDRASWRQAVNAGVAAAVSIALYGLYIRPLISGWSSTGNPTPPLVSYIAHSGVPIVALAAFAVGLQLVQKTRETVALYCSVLLVASLVFIQFAPVSWNPRYLVFFMPPLWILATIGVHAIADGLGRGRAGVCWYGCVVLLLLPNLLSHLQDGSRHDYRAAAAVVLRHSAADTPVLSDDAETISYYLPPEVQRRLLVRTKVRTPPASEFLLVTRANAWASPPQIPGRRVDLLTQIYRRRFDQFSHILRVYRVHRATAS